MCPAQKMRRRLLGMVVASAVMPDESSRQPIGVTSSYGNSVKPSAACRWSLRRRVMPSRALSGSFYLSTHGQVS
jgi:hypothetical protein